MTAFDYLCPVCFGADLVTHCAVAGCGWLECPACGCVGIPGECFIVGLRPVHAETEAVGAGRD
jgi:hypothetical protein